MGHSNSVVVVVVVVVTPMMTAKNLSSSVFLELYLCF